ncbi:MAG: hypothetical protein HC775_21445 [Hyellaceae cyanobacterium CSU_1_1]|nr:hypothetical protein [Hyellaceae cyanobacterium CSU_1_1]
MVERLKRWESPRKQGRNDKGKGGTARARQLRKREQMLRQRLKSNGSSKPEKFKQQEREIIPSLFMGNIVGFQESFSNSVLLGKSITNLYRYASQINTIICTK